MGQDYNMAVSTAVQLARNEFRNAYSKVTEEFGLPMFVVDGIMSELLCEIRSKELTATITDTINMFINAKKSDDNTEGSETPEPLED